jgi:hypothetical protein
MSAPLLAPDGYRVIEKFFDRDLAAFLYDVLKLRVWRGEARTDDQVPGAASFWGDTTLDAILTRSLPKVEAIVGCQLAPTYAYARVYRTGDYLVRHRDRAACEVAVTIHLAHEGAEPPPIHFAPSTAVRQRPGDAVVYLGDKVEHWRDVFDGDRFGQLFLNFVRADGHNRHLIYDGRNSAFPGDWLIRSRER